MTEHEPKRTRNPALTDAAIDEMVDGLRDSLEEHLRGDTDFELGKAYGALQVYQAAIPMSPEPFVEMGRLRVQIQEEMKQRVKRRVEGQARGEAIVRDGRFEYDAHPIIENLEEE